MKKFIKAIICIMLAAAVQPVSAYWDVPEDSDYSAAVERLSELGIVSGYADGSYQPDAQLTRAEFAKLVICMIDKEDDAMSAGYASSFTDAIQGEWYVPYINYAANSGIVTGYADGSYKPNSSINYAEASTILLRILGYSEADVGSFWPDNYFNKANSMLLAGSYVADPYAPINRGTAAIMLDTALFADVNSAAASRNTNLIQLGYTANKTLLDAIGYSVKEDTVIIASDKEDSSLGTDKIYTSAGKFDIGNSNIKEYVGLKGDLCLKDDDEVLFFIPAEGFSVTSYNVTNTVGSDIILNDSILDLNESLTVYYKTNTLTYSSAVSKAEKNDEFRLVTNRNGSAEYALLVDGQSAPSTNLLDKYVVYSVLNNAVVCYRNGVMSQLDMKDTTPCYRDGSTSSMHFSNMRSELEMGDVIYVKMDGSSVEYLSCEKGNMEGPVMVTSSGWTSSFATNPSTKIMRDGVAVSKADVKTNDIIYYSSDLNMVLAYTKKVTGVYESASPSKDSPTSVTISGVSYEIESVDAFNALSSSGSLKYGDTVTVCMGKDGKKIAGVVTKAAATSVIGYVTASGRKNFEKADGTNYTSYYLTIVSTDGTQADYPVGENMETKVSSAVRATMENGVAKIATLSASASTSAVGLVNAGSLMIGSAKIAEGCEILDTNNAGYQKPALYKRIYLQRLDGITLTASQVIYSEKNSAGAICKLILKDVSNDMYAFGILSSREGGYTIDVDGNVSKYSAGVNTSTGLGPVRAAIKGSTVTDLVSLKSYSGSISSIDGDTAVIGSKTYKLSDKVVCYSKTTGSIYKKISINDAMSDAYKNAIAYYDKAEENGGRIRIIVCTPK